MNFIKCSTIKFLLESISPKKLVKSGKYPFFLIYFIYFLSYFFSEGSSMM